MSTTSPPKGPPVGGTQQQMTDYRIQAGQYEYLLELIKELYNGHGEIYISDTVETVITNSDDFFPAAGVWTLSPFDRHWTMAINGQLRFTGRKRRMLHIACSWSMIAASNNQIVSILAAKNGITITPSRVQRKISTGTDVGTGALHAFTDAKPGVKSRNFKTDIKFGDYLEIQVRNTSGANNVTFETANLFVMDMAIPPVNL